MMENTEMTTNTAGWKSSRKKKSLNNLLEIQIDNWESALQK